jgi:S1-C subfamily serine protease
LTKFDVAVVVLFAVVAVLGWRRGFARTALPVIGGFIGVVIGGVLGPWATIELTSPADVGARAVLLYACFLGLPLLFAFVGARIAASNRRRRWIGGTSRLAGAAAAVALLMLIAWILAPMSQRQEAFVSASADSVTARVIGALPSPPVNVDALIAEGVLPEPLGAILGRPDDVPAPSSLPTLAAGVEQRLHQASVQLFLDKCGYTSTGSGFALEPDLVVTNAHVVQGATAGATVVTEDGRQLHGDVVLYDAARDLALVHVDGLGATPLTLAGDEADYGEIVVTAGHPLSDPTLHIAPARVDALQFYRFSSHVDGTPVVRRLYTLKSSSVQRGSSGGPVVNSDGEVLGVVFAVQEGDDFASAVAVEEIERVIDQHGLAPVATGSC